MVARVKGEQLLQLGRRGWSARGSRQGEPGAAGHLCRCAGRFVGVSCLEGPRALLGCLLGALFLLPAVLSDLSVSGQDSFLRDEP